MTEIEALREVNEAVKQDMEATFNSRLIVEYEKFSAAQEEKAKMVAEFEEKNASLIVTKDQALEAVKSDFLGKISKLELELQQVGDFGVECCVSSFLATCFYLSN